MTQMMNKQNIFLKDITKQKNLTTWYSTIIEKADFINYGQVKGTICFKPYAYKIWENIQTYFNEVYQNYTIENVYLPSLIPLNQLDKEKDHLDGFLPEVAIVNQVGQKKLNEAFFIRPTSEILFCEYFKANIVSYKDLPIKVNQWCNVIRWEKNTRPFLRNSEFLWQEGHTIHQTFSEAQQMTDDMLVEYKKFLNEILDIYCLSGTKTVLEKFAGAQETKTIELIMDDGQCLQAATSHFLGQNFTKIFNITYQQDNKQKLPYQASFGISTRIIGGILLSHGDDNGAIMPPSIAPYQVVILIVPQKNHQEELEMYAKQIYQKISPNFRTKIDLSAKTFGKKSNYYQLQGIPVRIIVGKKELENKEVTFVSRIDEVTKTITPEELSSKISEEILNIKRTLLTRSKTTTLSKIKIVQSVDEMIEQINTQKGVALAPAILTNLAEKELNQKYSITTRCKVTKENAKCIFTGELTKNWIYFGRAY